MNRYTPIVKSAQNQSFSSKICPKNPHEICNQLFFGKVSPENSHEYVSENPAKFAFFHNLSY